jgi:predicted transcriptional regulator
MFPECSLKCILQVKQQDREVGKHLLKLKSVRVPAERFADAVEKRKLALRKVAKMVGVGVKATDPLKRKIQPKT